MKRSASALFIILVTALLGGCGASSETEKCRPGTDANDLGPLINSKEDDFAPVVLENGKKLLFTSNRRGPSKAVLHNERNKYGEEVFVSTFADGKYGEPVPLHAGAVTVVNQGAMSVYADGARAIISRSDTETGGGMNLYDASGVAFETVDSLPGINSRYWDGHPAISNDGALLFFASDRPGGLGKTDLWLSRKTAVGWTAPLCLAAPVNSAGNEYSPFYNSNANVLYFSSNRNDSLGTLDIYAADLLNADELAADQAAQPKWAALVHYDAPVNTPAYDDAFPCFNTSDNRLYFASNRPGGCGGYNLYSTQIGCGTDLRLNAKSAATGDGINMAASAAIRQIGGIYTKTIAIDAATSSGLVSALCPGKYAIRVTPANPSLFCPADTLITIRQQDAHAAVSVLLSAPFERPQFVDIGIYDKFTGERLTLAVDITIRQLSGGSFSHTFPLKANEASVSHIPLRPGTYEIAADPVNPDESKLKYQYQKDRLTIAKLPADCSVARETTITHDMKLDYIIDLGKYNVPFFVTAYYIPNTPENFDRLQDGFNALRNNGECIGTITSREPGMAKNYEAFALDVQQIFDTTTTQVIGFVNEYQKYAKGASNKKLTIEVKGFSDPRTLMTRCRYSGRSIPDIGVEKNMKMTNESLAALRAYYTKEYIHARLMKDPVFNELYTAGFIGYKVTGAGIDADQSSKLEAKRRAQFILRVE